MSSKAESSRILIVDDDEGWAEVCAAALHALGHSPDIASSRKKAGEMISAVAYPLAFVDLNVPTEADGRETIFSIKQQSPETDVILMTASPTLETAIDILKEGACDYIIKPFSAEYLKTVVDRRFELRGARRELETANQLREELKAAYQDLQETERLKDAFLSRVSHELNTPLTYVSMSIGLLEEQLAKEPRYAKNISRARDGVHLLQETINDLLAFVDLQKPDLQFEKRRFDLGALLHGAVGDLKRLAAAKEIPLNLNAPPGMIVEGDALLLERAFGQIVRNAISFNKLGGSVDVVAAENQGWISVRVIDRGKGIPADKIGRIFESFYQAADYLTREVGGLGLGLSITKRIIEAHHGVIGVESAEGEGTTVKVELPAAGSLPNRLLNQ